MWDKTNFHKFGVFSQVLTLFFNRPGLCRFALASLTLLFLSPEKALPNSINLGVMEESGDVVGWRGITWGMALYKALELFKNEIQVHDPKFTVGNCHFSYIVPIRLGKENWQAWLCESRENATITGIAIERGYDGLFFGLLESQTVLFENFLSNLTSLYGQAQRYWRQCHNSRWHRTEQYRWYFPSTTISLVYRDIPNKHAAIHLFKPSQKLPDSGPGICPLPSIDLRKSTKP